MSGNPAGRPKGSKNAITLLKQSLELELREQAAPDVGGVLRKAVEMALAGDRQMIKLILELHISKPAHAEDEQGGKNQVNILVQNLTKDKPETRVVEVIAHEQAETPGRDGDPEEHPEEYAVGPKAGTLNGNK